MCPMCTRGDKKIPSCGRRHCLLYCRSRSRADPFERNPTEPIACFVHTAAAPRCAEQKAGPRFGRSAALAVNEPDGTQAVRESRPELPRPTRPLTAGGGRGKK